MSNYKSAISRINSAQTIDKLRSVGDGLARVYDSGQLTAGEYMRLDVKLCDRINLLQWARLRKDYPAIERAKQ